MCAETVCRAKAVGAEGGGGRFGVGGGALIFRSNGWIVVEGKLWLRVVLFCASSSSSWRWVVDADGQTTPPLASVDMCAFYKGFVGLCGTVAELGRSTFREVARRRLVQGPRRKKIDIFCRGFSTCVPTTKQQKGESVILAVETGEEPQENQLRER